MRGDRQLRRYLRGVVAAAGAPDRDGGQDVLATVAIHVGDAHGADIRGADLRLLRGARELDDPRLVPPPPVATPELLGHVHAALLAASSRRRGGVFMTPAAVAQGITDVALGAPAPAPGPRRVCDPAVGGGAFLLAAARRLAAGDGAALPEVVGRCLFGSDVDPLAVAVAEAALAILGWGGDGPPPGLAGHLVAGDPLVDRDLLPGPFDVVLANPPFLNQLERGTARSRADAAAAEARFGPAARGYVDAAALFLLLGLDLVRPGGRVGMLLPDSVLSTRDAAPARHVVAERASLEWVWLGRERIFDAGVAVCAVVAEVGAPQRPVVARAAGAGFQPLPSVAAADVVGPGSWAPFAADLLGAPLVEVATGTGRSVGDECRVTADFRDQFYGLAPLVEEAPDGWSPGQWPGQEPAPADVDRAGLVAVVTCGLVDPAACRWGTRPMRIGGRRFVRPVVDLDRLEAETALGPWARARLVPKLVVATQTRVVEAIVDERGGLLPSTPAITVEVAPGRAWHVAAALMAPPISALALRLCAGAALSPDAIKLTAKQVAALPLPGPDRGAAWDEGAAAVRRATTAAAEGDEAGWAAALRQAGEAMCRAYAVTDADADALLDWWWDRVPRGRPTTSSSPGVQAVARSRATFCRPL